MSRVAKRHEARLRRATGRREVAVRCSTWTDAAQPPICPWDGALLRYVDSVPKAGRPLHFSFTSTSASLATSTTGPASPALERSDMAHVTARPKSVTVCGVRCDLREAGSYGGAPDAHTSIEIKREPHGWAGSWWMARARGTRGGLRVETWTAYSDPRRCAEALTRLVSGWGVAEYSR